MTDGSGPGVALLIWLGIALLLAGTVVGFVVTRRRALRATHAPPTARPAAPEPPEVAEVQEVEEPPPPLEAPKAPQEPVVVEAPPPVEAPPTEAPPVEAPRSEAPPPTEAPPKPRGRVRSIGASLRRVFRGPSFGSEEAEELEEVLLRADVGVAATARIVDALRARDVSDGMRALREELLAVLGSVDRSMHRKDEGLTVWLITGVNGAGKTTTIGKLAAQVTREGSSVVLAAADTFRAAADEQLQRWAERAGAEVVRHAPGADPAAVVFDGVAAARARNASVLIVDTAGRLQTKSNLMDELAKINRVLEREAGPADEVLLVLDATTGQNGLQQARAFADATPVSGLVLTKLDGTAKGGIVIAVQQELGIPVKLVGLGEGIDDLSPFDPEDFVDALLEPDSAEA